jgi:glycosyltransferase involved in cell wall biosynthesis
VLVAGWVNSPHVTSWAAMLVELDHEVALFGHPASHMPPAKPPEGIAAYVELRLGRAPLLRSLQLGRDLRRTVQRLKPELVHAHWLPEYGWLAARAELHPLVSSAWGSDVLGAGLLGRRRSSAAISGSDLVLADSAALAEAIHELVPACPPVRVFHPGVDLQMFSPGERERARELLGWPLDGRVVLSPRALSPIYNPVVLIRAFARLRHTHPDARLVLKHPGPSFPAEVAGAIRAAGATGAVDVIGHLEATVMPVVYRAADVVVSIPSSDSSPATAWEALACARPLVVSDLAWARAELCHRENAWITRVDEDAVVEALASILDNPQLAVELGTRGHALAASTRDRRAKMRELDAHYRALVPGSLPDRNEE